MSWSSALLDECMEFLIIGCCPDGLFSEFAILAAPAIMQSQNPGIDPVTDAGHGNFVSQPFHQFLHLHPFVGQEMQQLVFSFFRETISGNHQEFVIEFHSGRQCRMQDFPQCTEVIAGHPPPEIKSEWGDRRNILEDLQDLFGGLLPCVL